MTPVATWALIVWCELACFCFLNPDPTTGLVEATKAPELERRSSLPSIGTNAAAAPSEVIHFWINAMIG